MRKVLGSLIGLLLFATSSATAGTVTYTFSGTVADGSNDPFTLSIGVNFAHVNWTNFGPGTEGVQSKNGFPFTLRFDGVPVYGGDGSNDQMVVFDATLIPSFNETGYGIDWQINDGELFTDTFSPDIPFQFDGNYSANLKDGYTFSFGGSIEDQTPGVLLDATNLTVVGVSGLDPTPEPSTWLLLLLGFFTVGIASRTRLRAQTGT